MLQARKIAAAPRPAPAPASHDHHAGVELHKKRRSPRVLGARTFLLLAGCFLFSLVIIAQYSSMVTLHYRLGRAESRMEALQEEYRQLEQEAARLSSLARIETIARSELGMREPEPSQVRVLTASRDNGSAIGE